VSCPSFNIVYDTFQNRKSVAKIGKFTFHLCSRLEEPPEPQESFVEGRNHSIFSLTTYIHDMYPNKKEKVLERTRMSRSQFSALN
jgi:hypothetical protein